MTATPALNVNQFSQIPVLGEMDLQFPGNTLTGQVDTAQVANLTPGQAVKLATTGGGVPKVIALAADSDQPFGFLARNLKNIDFAAGANVEIAQFQSCMWMLSGGAITRGGTVEFDVATKKVVAAGGTNPVCGYALDKAAGDGELIRVIIQAPYSGLNSGLTNREQQIVVSATLAEINAGKVLIPAAVGQKINLTNYIARVTGTFGGGTNIILESTNGTPVVISTILDAALTNGAVLGPFSANTTLGAGFAADLGTGDGVKVVSTGTQTTATKIDFTLTFTQQ